jgi:Tubulin-tyrosine ligase family.
MIANNTNTNIGWNPVCIWLYDDCYIRFAVEQYKDTPEKAAKRNYKKTHEVDKGWVTNQFRHLVNNSIGKTSSKFHEPFMVELTGHVVNGYMWSLENFKVWLKKLTGEDKWETSLRTEIQNIVIDAILCAQEDILPGSQRAFEIYGFDIMMDQRLKPWLIEINSSPACDYSTPVSECFVKRALPDVLKVVIPDDWVSNKNYTKNTGGWKKYLKGL